MQKTDDRWWLYLLECSGGLTYVGTASDVETRFKKHLAGKGARFTKINKPLSIIAAKPYVNRSEACKAEYALKQKSLKNKLEWAAKWPWLKL